MKLFDNINFTIGHIARHTPDGSGAPEEKGVFH